MNRKGLHRMALAALTLIPVMGGWAFAQESPDGRPLPSRPGRPTKQMGQQGATPEGMGAARQRMVGTIAAIDPEKGTLAVKETGGEAPVSVQVNEQTRITIKNAHGLASASLKELPVGAPVRVVTSPSPKGPPVAAVIFVMPKPEGQKPVKAPQDVSGQKGQRP